MAKEFEKGKKYVFSLELYVQDCTLESEDAGWLNKCKGQNVTVIDANNGKCKGWFIVDPSWCEEVPNVY